MNTQKGFTHAVLIIGLVLALVGALGFIFWQNFIHKEPAATKVETVESTRQDNAKEESVAKTYSIEEYGIQFTVPVLLENTEIKHEKRQIGEASFLAFTTQRVIDLGGDCSKGYPFGDLVSLSRDDEAISSEYDVYTSDKIGGYYYHIGTVESSGLSPKSTCVDNKLAENDLNSLVDALKTLSPQD